MAARVGERRRPHAACPARRGLAQRSAVAQRVRLVEEDDHSAVPQRELPQLAEQRFDLEDPDAHEHVDERAGVDEHVRAAGLAGHGLGHQRLSRAGRTPQQDPAGNVAALLLDLFRLLQEHDVLANPLYDVVLTPHVGETRLDVVRVVGVHPAAREQPEQADELERDEEEREGELQDHRQRLPHQRGRLEQREHRRGLEDLTRDHGEQRDERNELDHSGEPEARPVGEPPLRRAVEAAEDPVRPEPVVGGPVLADQVVDLPDQLQAHQPEQPLRLDEVQAHGVDEREQRVVGHRGPHQDQPDRPEQEQQPDPVPQRHLGPGGAARRRPGGRRIHGRSETLGYGGWPRVVGPRRMRRSGHELSRMVKEETARSISPLRCS